MTLEEAIAAEREAERMHRRAVSRLMRLKKTCDVCADEIVSTSTVLAAAKRRVAELMEQAR